MMTVPVLETDRLILKPLSLEDSESYQKLCHSQSGFTPLELGHSP